MSDQRRLGVSTLEDRSVGMDLTDPIARFREPAYIALDESGRAVASCDRSWAGVARAVLPPIHPEWLGGPAFPAAYGTRFSYVVGEMANGIATARMVVAAAEAGCLGVFGAAGLSPAAIEAALHEIANGLPPGTAWAANLIHSPWSRHSRTRWSTSSCAATSPACRRRPT